MNMAVGRRYKVYKVSRTLNTSAHVLASQARYPLDRATNEIVNCPSAAYISNYPIRDALDLVHWVNLTHLTAL
jgi:hypothetical protein